MGSASPKTLRATYFDRTLRAISRYFVPEIQLVIDYEGAVDAGALERGLRLLLDVEPVLGCRLAEGAVRIEWQRLEREALDAARLLRVVEAEEGAVDAATESFLLRPFPTERGPQVRALLVRTSGGDRLVLKVNHIATDTAGTKQVAYRLAELVRRIDGSDPAPGAARLVNDGSRSLGQLYAGLPPREVARLYARSIAGLMRYYSRAPVLHVPAGPNRRGEPLYEIRHIPEDRVRRIKDFLSERGATVNDLFVAATLRAIAATTPWDGTARLRLATTVDLRRHIRTGATPGVVNLTAFATPDLGTDLGEDIEETTRRVKDRIDAMKQDSIGLDYHLGIAPLSRVLPFPIFRDFLTGTLARQHRLGSSPSTMTNLGVIDLDRLILGGRRPVSAFAVVPVSRPPVVSIGLSGDGKRLTMTCGFYESSISRATVAGLYDAVEAELPS